MGERRETFVYYLSGEMVNLINCFWLEREKRKEHRLKAKFLFSERVSRLKEKQNERKVLITVRSTEISGVRHQGKARLK